MLETLLDDVFELELNRPSRIDSGPVDGGVFEYCKSKKESTTVKMRCHNGLQELKTATR